MPIVAHLSDLHFGRIDPLVLPALHEALVGVRPDLLAVSGDLTQRAHRSEFREARAFLDSLPFPRLVVPGNHDVPLYNLHARWLRPFGNYKAAISADLEPVYMDRDMAVVGINTARALTVKNGRINAEQAQLCHDRFAAIGSTGVATRIVVAHHPFILPEGADANDLVGRAKIGLLAFARAGVDMILSGHLHVSRTLQSAPDPAARSPAVLLVQAGTATSSRRRDEMNAFNVLRIGHPEVEIERWAWSAALGRFDVAGTERRRRVADAWERVGHDG